VEGVELSGAGVLVTGGSGFIGAWLVGALVDRGERVLVVDRDPTRSLLGYRGRVEVVVGDVCSDGVVARALAEYSVGGVFHLAAQTLVGPAHREPVPTFDANIRGTWMVLEACRASPEVSRVVVASSDKAYGRSDELPHREAHPLRPVFPYEVSKAACDMLARSYWHTFGLPVAVTRFANVYGGGDLNRSRLIPEAACAALAGRPPVIRSDGSPERDFLYVEDAVAAYLAIWDALERGHGHGEAFNAGGGEPHRVLDVVELVCRLAGAEVEPEVLGIADGEIDRQWVDSSKLTGLTGWRPKVPLELGLTRTIEWYRARV
jgi:CDP-glucose 4,6-dehydratase